MRKAVDKTMEITTSISVKNQGDLVNQISGRNRYLRICAPPGSIEDLGGPALGEQGSTIRVETFRPKTRAG